MPHPQNWNFWLSFAAGSKPPVPPSLLEATSDYADKEQKQGRSNGSDDNFADDPSANMIAQPRKQPTADQASYDADGNVPDETKAAAGHQFSCQPSRDEADQQNNK